ncbi:CAP domain-containing protein [Streptomyces sp. NBC_00178]|uniref:CAP domain-containing protein n=1 Tax=Streptomyces sp. NBC_00178 TaxID=2975672 RepID=UPI002E2D9C3B|nr:CAP domain-containing protein [Streptomyces sp. NBC_00178]
MGRHRRAGAAPAAEQHAAEAAGGTRSARRKKRVRRPVRAGLLGVSAAVAVGAVAVASGLVPGGDTYSVSGGPAADQVRSGGGPDLLTQGDASAKPTAGTSAPAEAGSSAGSSAAPSASPSATPSTKPSGKPSASPSKRAVKTPERTKAPAPEKTASSRPATKAPTATKTPSSAPTRTATAPSSPASTSAQAAVLALVNEERAKVGCSPVTRSAPLTALAQAFSEDMAARDFFGHTDPDGATPWDRAAAAGVEGLGGENIARGQADAQAVMDAWMNSEGHRANILNCDYKTLGVGVHLGAGGPWWTQDFGF